ncbi:protein-S-isoprenylcysteine O-methyltransferase Ste14 [Cytobacillus eiseniae]|uniref:Protein-S-isoprenylcysteine O-methyltransferase Ste14 n=1 Tax=Cytobacillus eiseniae TaxID=762947 RepID=A0ABS4R9D5_9BACI|nr:DUF4181 domain-containing protein [Cytobacillus eiseniae]MBP2239506.1 protein-S-isoprenylcysteine O-methyltransferase Ste14 [Cytobacillus eiseniae]
MYGIEGIIWLKIILMIVIILFFLVLFNTVMRKWLKVEKKKLFSHNYVNEKHKKFEWIIRISIVVMLFGFFAYSMSDPVGDGHLYLKFVSIIMFIFIIAIETLRAFMEWKYAANKKAYILTISQLVFVCILLLSIITNNYFGLLD